MSNHQNTRNIKINNCDEPIDSLTGRNTELSNLSSKFNKYNIVVIHGVGGVGKTQLARKFAADNEKKYNFLFWLQAECQKNLIEQLRELALELEINDAKNRNINQIRNEIYDKLKDQPALLIFDNVLNEANIKKYLPPVTEPKNTEIHILITSQFQDWNKKTVKCLPLIHLEEFYALKLLNNILNNELDTNWANAKDRKTLVRMLQYMPLSIQIAATYINTQVKQNGAFTITRYIKKLTNNAANIHTYEHTEYGKTLDKSIKIALDIIREDNSRAMELLYIMAFLNSDPITKKVLSKILKINSNDAEDDFCEALQIIINYSLIGSFDNTIYLHRNIQNIIRDELKRLDSHIFLKYYKLVLDYELKYKDQNSINNTYIFNHAKDYTQFILQYYTSSKSARLLILLCKHSCFTNVKVIFTYLKRNMVHSLIKQHGLLHCATLSSDIQTVKIIWKYKLDINMKYGTDNTTSLHIACMYGYVDIVKFLITKGADINVKCKNGRIALHYASIGLHYDIVYGLLHFSPDAVAERDKNNQTPLQLVLNTHKTNENNDKTVQIARLLVEKGANPDTTNDELYKVIHIAAHNGNYEFLAYLLDHYELDVNAKNIHGNTPLLCAVAASKFIPEDHLMNSIKLLIENGASVETNNNDDCNLLHVAAQYCHTEIISYLIQQHKISIDKIDSYGRTPLFCAMRANKSISEDDVMATVKLLIENGATVETINDDGCNLLHAASQYCHNQIISYLIHEHNISASTPDSSGRTPLFYALLANESISEDEVVATVKLLIKNGANAETITSDGCSLLHVAAEYCHNQIISCLIQEHIISVDTLNSLGQTPLYTLLANKSLSEHDILATVKLLIKNGTSINLETITNDGHSLLHVAAQYCHKEIISYLIQQHKISIDKIDSYGRTPLFCAMRANKSISEDDVMATVKLLIKYGASVETINDDGCNLLHAASQYCHNQIISYLIHEHNIFVDTPDYSGWTPLHYALLADKSISEDDVMATVKLLMEYGASVEKINHGGCSLLHAASQYCHGQIISCLIQEHNISVDTQDSLGQTPLFYALLAKKSISEDDVMATVKLLIENGANADTITKDGCNLLHFAAQYCHKEIISYLIKKHKISIDKIDSYGRTPLFCAMRANKSISEDDVMATVKLLIENGASVETINDDGCNLLHSASQYCHNQIISYLIHEHNISVDTPDYSGWSPLFYALLADKSISEDDVMATVKLLIEYGANAETIDNIGCSLLHVAAEYCRDQIISYLIQDHNISVDTLNSSGLTPLFYALFADKSISEDDVMATVKLLIVYGARAETIENNGRSLLHVATKYCRDQIISYLIQEHNISVDTPDSLGRTPLFYALLADKSISEDDVMATVKLLIEYGAGAETIENNGRSLLHVAAKYCRDQIISYLIQEHNISVDTPDSLGRTPLFYALFADKSISEDDVMATVKLLIEYGANAETIDNDDCSLLHIAAEYCHNQIISYLIQEHNISVDTLNSSDQNPLFHVLVANKSISEDHVMATLKLLIEYGANAEIIDKIGCSLLHVAAEYCRDQIISYLIQDHNISVDTLNSSGQNPLFHVLVANKSISKDHVMSTFKLLIENGANAETIDNVGCSLLHIASEYCHDRIISYLIKQHNISVHTRNSSGRTPLYYALFASKQISEDDVMATVNQLIENGADTQTITNDGRSLLHVAAEFCHFKIISYLFQEHIISVDTRDNNGETPLFRALLASESIPEDDVIVTIKLLIAQGATVEATNNKGSTILHYAAQCGRYQALTYLLHNYNIDTDTKDEDGNTPLHCALIADESINQETVKKIIEILLFNGASINLKNRKDHTALDLSSAEIREVILKSYAVACKIIIPEIIQQ